MYFIFLMSFLLAPKYTDAISKEEKWSLKEASLDMFRHAYRNYMEHAYPADELMPLSCKGRYRGSEPSRGDIDEVLGNFSLTLIDSLDTLVVLGELDDFEKAVGLVIRDVRFDKDIVVSVFETNIRIVGGLLGGHLMAEHLKNKFKRMLWYKGELLELAQDMGDRLLPAFNTTTGIPFPRVNLKYGINHQLSRTGQEKDTCTACAGTMILEFSALSRLTGRKIYEAKAVKAMDYLWQSRHSTSDLVGTVINIQNGDWVRKESGVGAGIDSYYEYLLKAYIMLGDDRYLTRFNTHYKAVMKYINNGPLMLDVHMHRPQLNSRTFMDSLLAFWPGLQVLKGDLKSAIEIHEMLYQVMLRHNFLPEAFTNDFRVHWAQHPLRPEFLESTYFIYKATGDPHYLEVGKKVLENLNQLARVDCGFAALKDVTTGVHEDQMDSFVFAETFKYLFLLFSEKDDLVVNVDDYILTTEAHLLPLFLSSKKSGPRGHGYEYNKTEQNIPQHILDEIAKEKEDEETSKLYGDDDNEINADQDYDSLHDSNDNEYSDTCPSANHLFKNNLDYAKNLRFPLKHMVENLCPKPTKDRGSRLKAIEFIAGNQEQMKKLNDMGIRLVTMENGRVQLVHVSSEALSTEESQDGMLFMQEMIELSKQQSKEIPLEPRVVQILSAPSLGNVILKAGPAQFGMSLKNQVGVSAEIVYGEPFNGCIPFTNAEALKNKFVIVERGNCMFIDKARNVQEAKGIGTVVFDNNSEISSSVPVQFFSMSGDGKLDVLIPVVFLFAAEANVLKAELLKSKPVVILIAEKAQTSNGILDNNLNSMKKVDKSTNGLLTISNTNNFNVEPLEIETIKFDDLLKLDRIVKAKFDALSLLDKQLKILNKQILDQSESDNKDFLRKNNDLIKNSGNEFNSKVNSNNKEFHLKYEDLSAAEKNKLNLLNLKDRISFFQLQFSKLNNLNNKQLEKDNFISEGVNLFNVNLKEKFTELNTKGTLSELTKQNLIYCLKKLKLDYLTPFIKNRSYISNLHSKNIEDKNQFSDLNNTIEDSSKVKIYDNKEKNSDLNELESNRNKVESLSSEENFQSPVEDLKIYEENIIKAFSLLNNLNIENKDDNLNKLDKNEAVLIYKELILLLKDCTNFPQLTNYNTDFSILSNYPIDISSTKFQKTSINENNNNDLKDSTDNEIIEKTHADIFKDENNKISTSFKPKRDFNKEQFKSVFQQKSQLSIADSFPSSHEFFDSLTKLVENVYSVGEISYKSYTEKILDHLIWAIVPNGLCKHDSSTSIINNWNEQGSSPEKDDSNSYFLEKSSQDNEMQEKIKKQINDDKLNKLLDTILKDNVQNIFKELFLIYQQQSATKSLFFKDSYPKLFDKVSSVSSTSLNVNPSIKIIYDSLISKSVNSADNNIDSEISNLLFNDDLLNTKIYKDTPEFNENHESSDLNKVLLFNDEKDYETIKDLDSTSNLLNGQVEKEINRYSIDLNSNLPNKNGIDNLLHDFNQQELNDLQQQSKGYRLPDRNINNLSDKKKLSFENNSVLKYNSDKNKMVKENHLDFHQIVPSNLNIPLENNDDPLNGHQEIKDNEINSENSNFIFENVQMNDEISNLLKYKTENEKVEDEDFSNSEHFESTDSKNYVESKNSINYDSNKLTKSSTSEEKSNPSRT